MEPVHYLGVGEDGLASLVDGGVVDRYMRWRSSGLPGPGSPCRGSNRSAARTSGPARTGGSECSQRSLMKSPVC